MSEIKILYQKAKEQSNGQKVKIETLKELAKDTTVNEININEFFKDFLARCQEDVTDEEFEQQVCKLEQVLLTMCLGENNANIKEEKEFVATEMSSKPDESTKELPKESERPKGYYLNPDDYTLDEYITIIRDMAQHASEEKHYTKMTIEEVGKFINDLKDYTDIAKKKAKKLSDDYIGLKTKIENENYQEKFFKDKIKQYQNSIAEFQNVKDNLAVEVEQMFQMEGDFKAIKDRNAELDIELLTATHELEELRLDNKKMQSELNFLKRENKRLDTEAMQGRSDRVEFTLEIEKLREQLAKLQPEAKSEESSKNDQPSASVIVSGTSGVSTGSTKEEPKEDFIMTELRKKMGDLQRRVDYLQSKLDVLCA